MRRAEREETHADRHHQRASRLHHRRSARGGDGSELDRDLRLRHSCARSEVLELAAWTQAAAGAASTGALLKTSAPSAASTTTRSPAANSPWSSASASLS